MSFLYIDGNPDKDNVFKMNVGLDKYPAYADLIEEYDTEEASKIIWAIAYVEDPESRLYRQSEKKKREHVEKTHMKGEKIKWNTKLIKAAIKQYSDLMPLERKFFKMWGDKIHECMAWMDDQEISQLLGGRNSPISNLEKLTQTYEKYKDKYEQHKASNSRNVGNYKPSRLERQS